MPYEDTVVEPGERLNMVVGPNGSGKSSIVGAINTVLCGPLKVKFGFLLACNICVLFVTEPPWLGWCGGAWHIKGGKTTAWSAVVIKSSSGHWLIVWGWQEKGTQTE